MNPEHFMNLVEEMRKAQKAYFASRTPENLKTSMRLEKEVDQVIGNRDQKSLF